MSKKLLCYRCFEKFQPHEVWFRCESTACKNAFPLHGFGARWRSRWVEPLRCNCPIDLSMSSTRICPHCHGKIPPWLRGQTDEKLIAIVGEPGAGKSHFLAVLIEQVLRGQIGKGFGASILAADKDARVLYNREFYEPLIFRLHLNRGTQRRIQRLTIVFHPPAEPELERHTRFLWNLSGIIFLVNPQAIPQWAHLLNTPSEVAPQTGRARWGGECASQAEFAYRGMVEELRKRKDIKEDKRIPIPLAVCISQFDRLSDRREDAGLDAGLFEPGTTPVRNGGIDLAQVERESDAIKAFMGAHGGFPANLTRQAEDDFASVGFFGVSALSASPEDGHVRTIMENRLEAPFFWILSELGLLKRERRFLQSGPIGQDAVFSGSARTQAGGKRVGQGGRSR